MDKLPIFSVDLIDELDKEYPNRWPSLNESDREIWFKAGQRSVVDKLIALKREAEENGEDTLLRSLKGE